MISKGKKIHIEIMFWKDLGFVRKSVETKGFITFSSFFSPSSSGDRWIHTLGM
jgi:hypothetical protein